MDIGSVRAFQPRKYDPPQFVAEDREDLIELEGAFVNGPQCDGCGNGEYQVNPIAPGTRQFIAVCAVEDADDEFAHPAPCGAEYRITIWTHGRSVLLGLQRRSRAWLPDGFDERSQCYRVRACVQAHGRLRSSLHVPGAGRLRSARSRVMACPACGGKHDIRRCPRASGTRLG